MKRIKDIKPQQRKILILIGSYLPGTRSAGVTMSISKLVEELGDEYDFYILTEDRDKGEKEPYQNVEKEKWTRYGKAWVFYSRNYLSSLKYFSSVVNSQDFDAYYINGFYNISDNARFFLLYLLRFIPRKPIVIAPRGIFSLGQFENKCLLRKIYQRLFSLSGLAARVKWHVTATLEKEDVLKRFPLVEKNITIIANISNIEIKKPIIQPTKNKGELKAMFISRISEKKNIKMIIKVLSKMKGNVSFDFYGMIGTKEDREYWNECKAMFAILPHNITVKYHGEVENKRVRSLFENHHLFFFPSFGENYGHVIAESLACACPIVLSDMTPWNMLDEYGAGANHSVNDEVGFVNSVQRFVDMSQEEWNNASNGAFRIAEEYIDKNIALDKYRSFFNEL